MCCSHILLQPGNSAGAVDIFILTFLQKSENSPEKSPPPPIITKYFRWTARYTNPVLKKVLNNNSRAFAFNNGGITKSSEFINHGSTKYFYRDCEDSLQQCD